MYTNQRLQDTWNRYVGLNQNDVIYLTNPQSSGFDASFSATIEYIRANRLFGFANYTFPAAGSNQFLADSPNDEIAIGSDIAICRERFDRYIGTGDDSFKLFLRDVERRLLEGLRSPCVSEEIWAEAKHFEKETFPAPKLTVAMLRAKRLGWMQ